MSLEHFGVNKKTTARVSVFKGGANSFDTWKKLPEESMAFMIAIGGGGSGGGGMTGATATIRGGGGGGGSGAIARLLVPLVFLPDTLYIQVGRGGAGVAPVTVGNAGERSYISIAQNVTAANVVLQSGNAAATGGAAGSTAGSAAAGAAETISTITLSMWGNVGISTFIAGKIGAIGGVVGGGAGSANTLLTASIMNGGAGGGTTPAANTEFAGGAQTGAGIFPTIAGGTATGGFGSGGYEMTLPIIGYGGAGGGTGGAGTAGNGGDGVFPGGGGGGGGGGITGGRGGRGGDGGVWIISW